MAATAHYVEQTKSGGVLLLLDNEKAYDRVKIPFLLDTLRAFGFPEAFIRLISIMYTGLRTGRRDWHRRARAQRPPSHHHRPTLYHLQLTHTVPSSSPVRGIRARVGTLSGRRRLAGTAAARAPRARHARRASLLF